MNILCIFTSYPLPTDSGDKRRNLAVLSEFSRRHNLTVTAITDSTAQALSITRQYPWTLHCASQNSHKLMPALKALFTLKTYRETKFYNKKLQHTIDDLLNDNSYDAIWIGQLCMTIYIENYYKKSGTHDISRPLLILDQHNEEESFWSSFALSLKNPLFRWFSVLEKFKNIAQQKRLFPLFDFIVSVSAEDRLNTINYKCDPKRVLLGPNGVDIDYFSPTEIEKNNRRPVLVFGGSLDVIMNQDAIVWFLDEVFPQIIKVEDVELHIVGRNPSKNIINRQTQNIKVFANVPDVRDYYRNADVFIIPLLSGGGTKLKTLEAMSMALPIVTTSIGSQGLDVISGKQCLIADTPAMFASSVIELINNEKQAKLMGQDARLHVINHFSWAQIMSTIEKEMNQHIKKHGQAIENTTY